jgi:uncharacterized protein YndB with AHSA1/START domain
MATFQLPYGGGMTNATIPDTIERSTELPHPVDRVWAALTDPAEFGRWFSQSASWELREGAPMTMTWDEHGTAPGVIVAVEPTTRFAYRWGSEDRPLEPGQSTLVEWTLAPNADGGTTLSVVESGFATLYNGPQQIVDNTGGWKEQFDNITRYLAGG